MNIRTRRELKTFAAQRLTHAPQEKKIVAIYSGLALAVTAFSLILSYVLDLRISQSGGLSNMGSRAVLSAIQMMLPLAQSVILTCLEVGYLSTMLRIARGQYASPNGLRLGFDRFWVLLRASIFQGLVYSGIGFLCIYLSTYIFLLTPLSSEAMEILMPLVSDTTILSSGTGLVLEDAVYAQLLSAMTPMVILCGVIYAIAALPVLYGYRMVNFLIIDKPAMGAMRALKESRRIMKHNRVALFRLDLSLWPYYLALLVATLLGYGDQILPMLGIPLPISGEAAYFLSYAIYLAAQFAVFYFLRNPLEVSYALAYDSIKPEEPKNEGVVLGNIFQM